MSQRSPNFFKILSQRILGAGLKGLKMKLYGKKITIHVYISSNKNLQKINWKKDQTIYKLLPAAADSVSLTSAQFI